MRVCLNCITDDCLAARLQPLAEEAPCDCCDCADGHRLGVDVDHVVDAIEEAVYFEYDDPANELPWESREGGWQGKVIDGWNMFMDYEFDEFTSSETVLEYVADHFTDRQFCKKHYFTASEDEAMKWSWEAFARIVKHQSRFFFRSMEIDEFEEMGGEIAGSKFLDHLPEVVNAMGIVSDLPVRPCDSLFDSKFYRSRLMDVGTPADDASALGSPPLAVASLFANRMSPAGVSMFYGAIDRDTAEEEVIQAWKGDDAEVVTGTWRPSRLLKLLDLSGGFVFPSIFDEANRHLRPKAAFLRRFAMEIARPVPKDHREHVSYAPTQVVTEFFRFVFPTLVLDGGERLRIDGIRYASAVHPGGADCVVIFADPDQCSDSGDETDETLLILEDSNRRRLKPR